MSRKYKNKLEHKEKARAKKERKELLFKQKEENKKKELSQLVDNTFNITKYL
jgi:hypothetical protein